jgi:hypothetical protein
MILQPALIENNLPRRQLVTAVLVGQTVTLLHLLTSGLGYREAFLQASQLCMRLCNVDSISACMLVKTSPSFPEVRVAFGCALSGRCFYPRLLTTLRCWCRLLWTTPLHSTRPPQLTRQPSVGSVTTVSVSSTFMPLLTGSCVYASSHSLSITARTHVKQALPLAQ